MVRTISQNLQICYSYVHQISYCNLPPQVVSQLPEALRAEVLLHMNHEEEKEPGNQELLDMFFRGLPPSFYVNNVAQPGDRLITRRAYQNEE
jgi:hypothetical protein